jgi:hypothetical protein
MEKDQVRRILRQIQERQILPLDQLREVTEWFREKIFSRPAEEWSKCEHELCQLWVTAAHNRKACIAHIRKRAQDLFGFTLPADIAVEGFAEGFAKFFSTQFLRYNPNRYPQYLYKEKLFMVFFRTCALNAAIDYFARQVERQKFDSIRGKFIDDDEVDAPEIVDDSPSQITIIEEKERHRTIVEWLDRLSALIERTLAAPEAERVVELLRCKAGVNKTARFVNIKRTQVTEIRHAAILKMLKEDAQKTVAEGQVQRIAADDSEGVYKRIAAAVGVSDNDARVYVLRARRWAFAKIGNPFLD